jgi:hypothetical protein
MTTTIENTKLELFRTEAIRDMADAVKTLDLLAAKATNPENAQRLQNKSDAIAKVLMEQSDRIKAVTTIDEAYTLAAFILGVAKIDGADEAGTKVAVDYMTRLIN